MLAAGDMSPGAGLHVTAVSDAYRLKRLRALVEEPAALRRFADRLDSLNQLRPLVDDAAALRRFADGLIHDAYGEEPAAERETLAQQIITILCRRAAALCLVCPACGQAAPTALVGLDAEPETFAVKCSGTQSAPHEPRPFGYRH